MSIRAYRINEIKQEENPSFNLWHDQELMDIFEEFGVYETLNEGSGITELPIVALKQALAFCKKHKDYKVYVKRLQDDIKWAKKNDVEYVQYYCF